MAADDTASSPRAPGESFLLTYVVPFVGVLLIALGIPAAILGGYVVMQDALGLCGEPDVEVRALGPDERPAGTAEEVPFENLSAAEREAIREAIDSPLEEAVVEGGAENGAVLREGAIVAVDGERYYVRIASLNSCLEAEPLLFPIGGVAILVGVAGVLTPPIYRRMAGFEERMRRRPEE
ncbi:hypothetical protein [Salinilacihabitans rarus]|uniref:hypothetical protein n=1 Tax=Salinilacihabitans rarus TaxID=2961596 RepID=UPI0020C921A4|nr:hypothetical protein [Salinilacihabitans rarus]